MPGNVPKNYFGNCHGCKDRYVGCHAKCDIYKEARAAWDKENETLKKTWESRCLYPEKKRKKRPRPER